MTKDTGIKMGRIFENILAPIDIGTATLKNRMYKPAAGTKLFKDSDGYVTEKGKLIYEAWARGGVGAVVVESPAIGDELHTQLLFQGSDELRREVWLARTVPRFRLKQRESDDASACFPGILFGSGIEVEWEVVVVLSCTKRDSVTVTRMFCHQNVLESLAG